MVISYAHADIGQLAFNQHIVSWVAPGGTLLIIGHSHGSEGGHGLSHGPGEGHGRADVDGATATLAGITDLFSVPEWRIVTSCEKAPHCRSTRSAGTPA